MTKGWQVCSNSMPVRQKISHTKLILNKCIKLKLVTRKGFKKVLVLLIESSDEATLSFLELLVNPLVEIAPSLA